MSAPTVQERLSESLDRYIPNRVPISGNSYTKLKAQHPGAFKSLSKAPSELFTDVERKLFPSTNIVVTPSKPTMLSLAELILGVTGAEFKYYDADYKPPTRLSDFMGYEDRTDKEWYFADYFDAMGFMDMFTSLPGYNGDIKKDTTDFICFVNRMGDCNIIAPINALYNEFGGRNVLY